jgi:calcineurin-like phosphoesterase family protein
MVIFSDLHYAPERPVNNGSIIERKLTDEALPLLNNLIKSINEDIKPDVVFNLGDIVEDFNNKEDDIVNLNFIWNKLKEIKVPFYSLAGNHDLRSMDCREDVERIMGYKHSTFSVDLNGYHFVLLGLDVKSDLSREYGGILKTQFLSDEDLEWLRQDLKANSLPCVILSHFGIAEDNMKGNWWFEKNPDHALLGNRKELKEILSQDKNLIAVFSGHQHWTKFHIEKNINYYVIGSMTENINDDGIPDGVYFEIELKNKDISILEKHIRLK